MLLSKFLSSYKSINVQSSFLSFRKACLPLLFGAIIERTSLSPMIKRTNTRVVKEGDSLYEEGKALGHA